MALGGLKCIGKRLSILPISLSLSSTMKLRRKDGDTLRMAALDEADEGRAMIGGGDCRGRAKMTGWSEGNSTQKAATKAGEKALHPKPPHPTKAAPWPLVNLA